MRPAMSNIHPSFRSLCAFLAILATTIGGGRADADPVPMVGTHVSYPSDDVRPGAGPLPYGSATGAEGGPIVVFGKSGALVISPTFDSTITGNVNSAAIQAMINNAIAIEENLVNDPITITIP